MTSKEEPAGGLDDCRFLYGDCDGFESVESEAIAYGDSVQLWVAPKVSYCVSEVRHLTQLVLYPR